MICQYSPTQDKKFVKNRLIYEKILEPKLDYLLTSGHLLALNEIIVFFYQYPLDIKTHTRSNAYL